MEGDQYNCREPRSPSPQIISVVVASTGPPEHLVPLVLLSYAENIDTSHKQFQSNEKTHFNVDQHKKYSFIICLETVWLAWIKRTLQFINPK